MRSWGCEELGMWKAGDEATYCYHGQTETKF